MTRRIVGRPPRRSPAWSWPSNYDLAVSVFGLYVVFLESFSGRNREIKRSRTTEQLAPYRRHSNKIGFSTA